MSLARLIKRLHILVLLFLGLAAVDLYGQVYITPFSEARWVTQSGPFSCELSQKISGFGSARFLRKTGHGESFQLTGTRHQFDGDSIRITAVPPAWRSDSEPGDLGRVTPSSPLIIQGPQVASIIQSLKQGSNLIFIDADLRVGLEGRDFSAAYAQYQSCIKAMIPHTFGQLARTQLHYGVKDEALGPANKSRLDNIIRYMKADKNVLGIIVDAHADKQPTPEASEELSKRQADLVANYLGEQGIPAEHVTARWHGDKFPIATNGTKAGQASNRRIVLRLEDAKSRKVLEEKVAAKKAAEDANAEDVNKASESKQVAEAAGASLAQIGSTVNSSSSAISTAAQTTRNSPAKQRLTSSAGTERTNPEQKITPAELEKMTEEHRFFTPIKKPDAVTPK